MATQLLGEQLDIDGGGVDNIFPHHEAEIAQTEGCTEKQFVRYWLDCANLLVDGQKCRSRYSEKVISMKRLRLGGKHYPCALAIQTLTRIWVTRCCENNEGAKLLFKPSVIMRNRWK
jgi:cysteinyl-tRNA synthetase